MAVSLPALTENARLRYVAFGLLYVAQGIPEGMIFFALPAYLAVQGVEAGAIAAFVSVSLLPWTFKVLDGPLMDRFTFLPMGRRRPWVLFGQIGLVAAFAALSTAGDPVEHLALITAGCVAVSFFGAFQDVAVDGMVIDVVPVDEQARVNGVMWGGKTLGVAGSTAVGSWLIHAYGFGAAVLGLAGLTGCIMLVPLLVRERPDERLLPWTAGAASPAAQALQLDGWRDIGGSLLRVFVLPMSLFVAVVAFLGSGFRGYLNTLLPVFTVQELGWTDTGYAEVMATVQIVAGLIGMGVGGWFIDRVGRKASLVGFLCAMAVTAAGMGLLPMLWRDPGMTTAFIYLAVGFDTLFAIALFATAMAVCWQRVSATQFCLYMALGNLGMSAGAAGFGVLSGWADDPTLFFALAGIAALGIACAGFVRIEPHLARLERLDDALTNFHPDPTPAALDPTPPDLAMPAPAMPAPTTPAPTTPAGLPSPAETLVSDERRVP